MPHFQLVTNVPQNQIPADLPQKICSVVSASLGKPFNNCAAAVIGGSNLFFGGSNEPAALTSLVGIGAQGVEENKNHSKVLFDLIGKELKIPSDRMVIDFFELKPSHVGHKGTTCHELFKV